MPARALLRLSLGRSSRSLLGPLGLAVLALPALLPSVAQAQEKSTGASAKGGLTLDADGATRTGSAQANASTPSAAPAADTPAAIWAERDRRVNESATIEGSTGLLRTKYAQGLASGQFRLQFLTDMFSSGWLCSAERPCVSPGRAGRSTDDHMSHVGGTLSLGVGITKWLEAYAATAAYASSDTSNDPQLIQVLGDSVLGAKVYFPVGGKVFHVGAAAELWLLNGTGSVGLAGDATSAKFHGLATADLRGLDKPLPLRFGFNLSYSVDNSGAIAEPTETIRQAPISRIERFSLRVNRVDHLDFKLGAEAFFVKERLRPFLEYGIDVPINRQGYGCNLVNPSNDGCLANDKVAPSRLTLGARLLPWKRGFGITAAMDIGVTGVKSFIEEMAPQAPWTLWLGLGWAVDTHDRPAVAQTVVSAPAMASLHGVVRDKESGAGVAEAIVAFASHPDHTSLSTGSDGAFHSSVAAGTYKLAVKAEGYVPGECTAVVPEAGVSPASKPTECTLQALPKVGTLSGKVHDETGAPIENAKLLAKGTGEGTGSVTKAGGTFKIDGLAPGSVSLSIEADGYFSATRTAEVQPRQDTSVDVELHKRPKNANVTVGAKEIVIKQQVQFAHNSAEILPASNGLLEEIADVLRSNPRIKRLEIQGHTDNTGAADYNQTLSDQRAGSVRSWLTDKGGVPADRLTSKGYGQSRPLVPNVTANNRARNRRVQFVITDQDAAPTGAAAPKTGGAAAAPTKTGGASAAPKTPATPAPKKGAGATKKPGGDDALKLDFGKP